MLINYDEHLVSEMGQIFACAMMVRPNRRHEFIVVDPLTKNITQQSFEVQPRNEAVPAWFRIKKQTVQNKFDKSKSYFAEWPSENTLMFTIGMKNDIN